MKVLIITRDSPLHAEISAQGAARIPPMRIIARRETLRAAAEQLVPDPPELVIVDASGIDGDETGMIERLCRHYPDSAFMLLTREHQQDLLIRAMRAGVRE